MMISWLSLKQPTDRESCRTSSIFPKEQFMFSRLCAKLAWALVLVLMNIGTAQADVVITTDDTRFGKITKMTKDQVTILLECNPKFERVLPMAQVQKVLF